MGGWKFYLTHPTLNQCSGSLDCGDGRSQNTAYGWSFIEGHLVCIDGFGVGYGLFDGRGFGDGWIQHLGLRYGDLQGDGQSQDSW